jgi:fructokinase
MTTPSIVVGLGELLWDLLPEGKKLGGAPANFAYHAGVLGHRSIVLSRLGSDTLGDEAADQLQAHGLSTEHVQRDAAHPTGTVAVELQDGHPSYTIVEDVAWDYLEATPNWLTVAASADAVCFGSLAQRHTTSRHAIRAFVQAVRPSALRIFDVNLRGNFYDAATIDESLRLSNVFKLNDQELPILAQLLGLGEGSEEERCAEIVRRYGLRLVALTRGKDGSLFVTPERSCKHPGLSVEVSDTIGAGDAFTAGVAHGLLQGLPLEEIAVVANMRGAWVATQAGAMPHADTFASFSKAHHGS